MVHIFLGEGYGSGPPQEIARVRGRHSPSTPLVFKATSVVYNLPFQKFLDPPLIISRKKILYNSQFTVSFYDG